MASQTTAGEPRANDTTGAKFEDFDAELEKFALEIVTNARALKGKQHFSERLDAFKAATAYKAMMNKMDAEDAGGAGIAELQADLLEEPPERPPATDPPGDGTDDDQTDDTEE